MLGSKAFKVILPAIVIYLGGCMASGSYDSYVTSYQQEVDQMKQANSEHQTAIMAAADMAVITTEESDHYTEMQQMMDDMMATTDDLNQCDTSMMGSSGTDMMGMNDSMQTELDTHHINMGAATTVEEAEQEETRHQTEMDSMIQSMESTSDQMMGMMGTDMGC